MVQNILIADAGSTKIDWCYLSSSNQPPFRFQTAGINAIIALPEEIKREIMAVKEQLGTTRTPDKIYYYGAGCATPEICDKIKEIIEDVFKDASAEVMSDLVGAARSLFGNKEGIACILGTGSNSALYNGYEIKANVPPLGFILGDEGSGTALGKRLINEFFKGDMDEETRNLLMEECGVNLPEILRRVYREPAPNKFIASFVPFIRKHLHSPFIRNMVVEEFRKFFQRNLRHYSCERNLPVAFTGSIAHHFESLLREAGHLEGYAISEICDTPMKGLMAFHSSNQTLA